MAIDFNNIICSRIINKTFKIMIIKNLSNLPASSSVSPESWGSGGNAHEAPCLAKELFWQLMASEEGLVSFFRFVAPDRLPMFQCICIWAALLIL